MSSVELEKVHQTVLVKQKKLLINGEFCSSVTGETFATISPVTERVIAQVAKGNTKDIDIAVQAARAAFEQGPWAKMSARERGNILLKWASLIDANQEELAHLEVLDNGKPISEALGYDIPSAAATIRYFAGWADKVEGKTIPISGDFFTHTRQEPVGVCGLIIPWNFPLAMAAWKLGPCLASGCTAILKPAEQTPLTALRVGELALDAGMPPGVLNIVTGFGANGAGEALVTHPDVDKIAFTGENKTAYEIKRLTAESAKRLSFELGGKSPNIIFDDVDLNEAVDGAFGAVFLNQGQNCCAGTRTFVHKKIYDSFIDKLAKKANERQLGMPYLPETEQGAQVDKAQFEKIMHYIELGKQHGAECVAGGERFGEHGFFIRPTVFADVDDSMPIAQEEIFGPVASVLPFESVEEVINRANNTPYGLAGAVWTNHIDKAQQVARGLRAGTVWINCYNIVDPAAPFGGFKGSGSGRELGEAALSLYTETKTVTQAVRG